MITIILFTLLIYYLTNRYYSSLCILLSIANEIFLIYIVNFINFFKTIFLNYIKFNIQKKFIYIKFNIIILIILKLFNTK
jgi:hypothetical protein